MPLAQRCGGGAWGLQDLKAERSPARRQGQRVMSAESGELGGGFSQPVGEGSIFQQAELALTESCFGRSEAS